MLKSSLKTIAANDGSVKGGNNSQSLAAPLAVRGECELSHTVSQGAVHVHLYRLTVTRLYQHEEVVSLKSGEY